MEGTAEEEKSIFVEVAEEKVVVVVRLARERREEASIMFGSSEVGRFIKYLKINEFINVFFSIEGTDPLKKRFKTA